MVSRLQKITELTTPVELGRFYKVPTIRYEWCGRTRDWPVFLPKHADAEFFNFPDAHYHIDPRFLSKRDFEYAGGHRSPEAQFQAAPLAKSVWMDGERGCAPHPPVVWRRRRCSRDWIDYHFGSTPQVQELRKAYAGQQCASSRGGWICPHQHYAMGSVKPDADGFMTCPLHGLRIHAETGRVAG